ncbi:hypothetical protein IMZ11_02155 [Microtetraspora sp. AC03309]|uniref:hypothetical protein n=1 Tax=Microtetraspora sp. AC03309 TaxID=2779376 RepID=UPI001E4D6481|nr:hypothetical protein [Microtetraspora sp. AC03309]MCC5574443.1 hypothetical protein [Microtetraspora sp. AC03309]
MPGRTKAEAFRAFQEPLHDALSCVAHAKVTVSPGGQNTSDRVHALVVNDDKPIKLKGQQLLLWVRMKYEIIPDDRDGYGPWRVTTRGYVYEVQSASGEAVMSWHWHPTSKMRDPHIHAGHTQLADDAVLSRKHHTPTGRVSLESVVRFCLEDLQADHLRNDWDKVLALREGLFKLHRSWH